MFNLTKTNAISALAALSSKDYAALTALGVQAYGNKGRLWTTTACITSLDSLKGECNPRLAFNACGVADIGCPKCLAALEALAAGKEEHTIHSAALELCTDYLKTPLGKRVCIIDLLTAGDPLLDLSCTIDKGIIYVGSIAYTPCE